MVEKKGAGLPSNREVILDAADQLVAAEGAAHLTFDALSQVTGISKGGLLYHFNSKDCLLQAMLKRRVERYEALRESYHQQFSDDPKGELKSILLTPNVHVWVVACWPPLQPTLSCWGR